ncbi:MAG: type I DNA topoisomerase [Proteobacteria bacterium]|nr:type I DNA topoisomerase [Pseudomonadota bacterium]
MKVVVVESPSKAKTIHKYLGPDYTVLASFGHVRDLPPKEGSVKPDDHFAMTWEVSKDSVKHMRDIASALKGAEALYLATDPDREGEAISWHIKEVLEEKKALKNIPVKRIVFNEITKQAVQGALTQPRDLDQGLVDAYLARRALDYLVGFTLSPVLWRRLPGSRSAGRVQSVALRLVADRESEIEAFRAQEYWSITATFETSAKKKVPARLMTLDGRKLDKFDITKGEDANALVEAARLEAYHVSKVEKKQTKRHPAPPFTTSTLQQEAARKLRFSAKKTMQLAQRLYEGIQLGGETVGLITYMRTDSVNIAGEALAQVRDYIGKTWAPTYLPKAPRVYKTKAKGAQEAHEAIRPTGVVRTPESLSTLLDKDQLALYTLIWKRFVACQMESALLDQVSVDIASASTRFVFRASGSSIAFDGFLTLYVEGRDDEDEGDDGDDENTRLLPPLTEKDVLSLLEMLANQHFTQPPPRYSEASLVKKLEELGIGRPSTYASILSTLLDRSYVRLEKRYLVPESLGRLLTAFLTQYFRTYVEYDFTAALEEKLDDISENTRAYLDVLASFWKDFDAAIIEAQKLRITDVLLMLEEHLATYIFPTHADGSDPRLCPQCKKGKLSLRLGKYGGFVSCSDYPACSYSAPLAGLGAMEEGEAQGAFETKELGKDPETGLAVTIRKGPYGFYYQWGEAEGKTKPKRVSLPKGASPEAATLEQALSLGALPRTVGVDPESGQTITAALGRFGPYVKRGSTFASLTKDDNVLTVDLERALALFVISEEKKRAKGEKGEKEGETPKKKSTPAKRTPKKT